MKNYRLLRQLISVTEQLENEYGQEKEISLEEFANYLKSKTDEVSAKKVTPTLNLKHVERTSDVIKLEKKKGVENNISRLLLLLVRHARNYAKKAFENTPLLSLEDFSYLASLYNASSVTKSELIAYNFQEKTSGSEVIRRLISNKLVSQFDDKLDKRSKRVSITPEGKKLLESTFGNMSIISEFLVLNLTPEERSYLLAILQKLDAFHRTSFATTRNLTLDELKHFKENL